MGLLLASLADWDGEHFLKVGKRMNQKCDQEHMHDDAWLRCGCTRASASEDMVPPGTCSPCALADTPLPMKLAVYE